MAGKVCIVTGAGSGIGAATAELLAEHGAAGVVCADLDGASAEATAQRIEQAGGTATAFTIDISSAADAVALIDHTMSAHGRLDVLHNNAGMGIFGAVHETSEADWERCLAVNLKGTFLVTKAALPAMMEQRRGAIVNTCSNHATVASPQLAAYHASKGGIRALTRQMARDYSPDIRINCVSPGLVDTKVVREGRVARGPDPVAAWKALEESNRFFHRAAQPREIAYGVLFLASDEASFITGHDLKMSGGQGEVAF
jgi:NAD(P)-dependent dehydrogenase (short-subunit alcohol dehydrogenase family)